MGERGPWYLNLMNNIDEVPEEFDGCPKVDNYELGYYGNDNAPGTHKFILDRLKWAQKRFLKELEAAEANPQELESSRW